MKKRIISIFAMLLAVLMIFSACGNPDTTPDESNSESVAGSEAISDGISDGTTADTTEGATEETTEPFVDESPYLATETYMKSDIREKIYDIFVNGKQPLRAAMALEAPYVINHCTAIRECKLLSITLPVQKTGKIDADGNFVLTIFVFGGTLTDLQKEAKRSYEIKINAAEYGLTANKSSVKKVIEVDLTSYDINIANNESIGYFAATDTIFPAIAVSNSAPGDALKYIRENAIYMLGSYIKVGGTTAAYSSDTHLVDFKWEKSYESKSYYISLSDTSDYDAMIAALREKYSGKYVSVVGDSISAYDGLCNDATANVTISNNADYYPTYSANVYDSSLMYWGKVIKELDMKPCVINAWSASMAIGNGDDPSMLYRAAQLHRDGGTPDNPADDIKPDVIIIYFGINDLDGSVAIDEGLYASIAKKNANAVAEWFPNVLKKQQASGSVKKNEGFTNFSEVYALSLNKMRELYPDAEIYCLSYQESNHPKNTKSRFKKFNATVAALAEYFGASFVDQTTDVIDNATCHAYAGDMKSLHPNAIGHSVMADNIMGVMYEKIKK